MIIIGKGTGIKLGTKFQKVKVLELVEQDVEFWHDGIMHQFSKFKNSFPRNIHYDLVQELIDLGYTDNNMPPRSVRHLNVRANKDYLLTLTRLDDNFDYNSSTNFEPWFLTIDDEHELSDNVKEHFKFIMKNTIYNKRKKYKPLRLLLKSEQEFDNIRLKLYEEYEENDDEYIARLKYIASN